MSLQIKILKKAYMQKSKKAYMQKSFSWDVLFVNTVTDMLSGFRIFES